MLRFATLTSLRVFLNPLSLPKPSILPQKCVLALVRKQAGAQDGKGARGFRPSVGKVTRKRSQAKVNAPAQTDGAISHENMTHMLAPGGSAPPDAHTFSPSPEGVPSRFFPVSRPAPAGNTSEQDAQSIGSR